MIGWPRPLPDQLFGYFNAVSWNFYKPALNPNTLLYRDHSVHRTDKPTKPSHVNSCVNTSFVKVLRYTWWPWRELVGLKTRLARYAWKGKMTQLNQTVNSLYLNSRYCRWRCAQIFKTRPSNARGKLTFYVSFYIIWKVQYQPSQ